MKFRVHLLAFSDPGTIREVEVPETALSDDRIQTLEQVFYFGQNDFQPQELPSVSMGDVIEYHDGRDLRLYMVVSRGFEEIGPVLFGTYQRLPQHARLLFVMQMQRPDKGR